MKPTQQLHDLGQSLWLDNITRGHLVNGILRRYVSELSITGLTSNPSIFDHAIKESAFYDDAIHEKLNARIRATAGKRGVDFHSYGWRRHCRGLYQTPIAA